MFASNAPRSVAQITAKLNRQHRAMLGSGEDFVAACEAFRPDQPHPLPLTRRGRPRPTRATRDELLGMAGAAHLRLAAVHAALGMLAEEFVELPKSPSGYVVGLTGKRLVLLDGDGSVHLADSDLHGVWLQPIDHGGGMFTLVFKDGAERMAVTTRRETEQLTRHFIESFPERRGKARVLHVVGPPTVADF